MAQSLAVAAGLVEEGSKKRLRGAGSFIARGLLVGAAYYLGALLGFELTFPTYSVSTLWPPNAILMAGLLLAPISAWGLILLCVFPAHLAVQLQSGVPLPMIFCWFISNS